MSRSKKTKINKRKYNFNVLFDVSATDTICFQHRKRAARKTAITFFTRKINKRKTVPKITRDFVGDTLSNNVFRRAARDDDDDDDEGVVYNK